VRLDLDLENVSDVANPIEISWGSLSTVLALALEDEAGAAVARDAVGGNELTILPMWLELPVSSTMHMLISKAAYEYVPTGRTMLRPFSFQAWDIPPKRTGTLYLKGKITPLPAKDTGHRAWRGPLDLPRVALPPSG
jgi:hypothetical protein